MDRRYQLKISYDGTDFCGWQYQKNGQSVQQVLIETLESIVGKLKDGIHGCSRTDAGVHADEFVCHFNVDTHIEPSHIVLALNTRLPDTVVALACKPVKDDFHARYSCRSKTYRYYIRNSRIPDPFTRKYEYLYSEPLDLALLNRAASFFVGTYDFSAFCSSGSAVSDRVRTVYSCRFTEESPNRICFEVTGDGFLYNMVRIMVGTLLAVNDGKISAEEIPVILASEDRTKAGPTAPACGLHLHRVHYQEN